MSQQNAMELVEKLYGTQRREGLEKFSVQHPKDVVDYCFLHLQKDNIRIIRLLNVAILHDVVEDYAQEGYTVERVQAMVGLGPKETKLLDLIARKQDPEYAYLRDLFAIEDGVIVKLADRIANLKDLQKWVDKEQGFTQRAMDIFETYRFETVAMLDLVILHYAEQMQDPDHPISRQVQLLQEVFRDLETRYKEARRKK